MNLQLELLPITINGVLTMSDIAELTDANTLKLPDKLSHQFHASDRFYVWVRGDSLHLKRITSPAVTDIVAEASEGDPLSLYEINKMVHQGRREEKTGNPCE